MTEKLLYPFYTLIGVEDKTIAEEMIGSIKVIGVDNTEGNYILIYEPVKFMRGLSYDSKIIR